MLSTIWKTKIFLPLLEIEKLFFGRPARRLAILPLGKGSRYTVNRRLGGPVRYSIDDLENKNFLAPPGNRKVILWSSSPRPGHFTPWERFQIPSQQETGRSWEMLSTI